MKEAFKEYKAVNKDAQSLRDQFFEHLSEARALRNNTSKDAELTKMKHVNNQRRLSNKVKSTREEKQRTATLRVYKTDTEGQRVECFTKWEVEEACIEENRERFTQNKDTPFLSSSLLEDIGYLAEKEGADQILQGNYIPPEDTDPYTRALIKELALPEGVELEGNISTVVTPEDNQAAWKAQKERISSQGLHFGHTKACSGH